MSIVLVKKCYVHPDALESFDSGIQAVDPAHFDRFDDSDVTDWLINGGPAPAPFDGCPHQTEFPLLPAIPADGSIHYACITSGGNLQVVYLLPLQLRAGIWSMTAEFILTTSRPWPEDGLFTYQDVHAHFQHDGWGSWIGYNPPPISGEDATMNDGDPDTLEWECDVPPIYNPSNLSDPCICDAPGRLYLAFEIGDVAPGEPNIRPVQAANVRFTGTWLSDFPP